MEIGGRIREVRKSAGLTQEELARRANMSLKGMGDIERGVIPDPHISSLAKIADALGMPVSELLGEPVPAGKAEAPEAGLEEYASPLVEAPPPLVKWLEERCGHAYLALPKDEFEEMFDKLPEDAPERRALALEVNQEYNTFCRFPSNATPPERLRMRGIIRDAIPEVAVKHGIALMEGSLGREYQEEAAHIFVVERATEREPA